MQNDHSSVSPPSARVLVLDGEQRSALAATRSLVRAGFAISVLADSPLAPAALSRGATYVARQHSSLAEPSAFAGEVATVAHRLRADVVLPTTDASVEAILEHRALFEPGIRLPFGALETYRAAADKVRVNALAVDAGIGIAETVLVPELSMGAPDVPELYPAAVKPHRSIVGGATRRRVGVQLVRDRAACTAVLEALPPDAFPVMIQRRVRGPGVGYFAARWNGRTIARFAHRRLREKPPSGGVSVLSESVALPDELRTRCDALLDSLGWEGAAMVECKEDLDRGGWRVMEINGRFWGSLQLAIDAGIDFPALLVRATLGERLAAPDHWRVGARLRWEWGDIDHLLLRLRHSRERLGLDSRAPNRLGALLHFLQHVPGRDRLELFRWRDPLPFFGETLRRLL